MALQNDSDDWLKKNYLEQTGCLSYIKNKWGLIAFFKNIKIKGAKAIRITILI